MLNPDDLKSGKVSLVVKPVYRGEDVVWLVRWAMNVVKAVGVEKPNISEEALAVAIRDKKCKINFVDNKIRVVMDV